MFEPKRIEPAALKAAFEKLPAECRKNGVTESFALGAGVVRAFFGNDWIDRHIMPSPRRLGYLAVDESCQTNLDLSAYRIIDLAELLYNLQHINGFDECARRMYQGDIEGTYAELDFGRMLFLHHVPFAYVVPQGRLGSDYDVELMYGNGLVASCDAKCKVESTELGVNTLMNTLGKGRRQLPEDRPGIVFVKVPSVWMQQDDFLPVVTKAAEDFLRNTRRVVSVKYYTSPVKLENGMLRIDHAYKEFSNRITDFGSGRNWDVFNRIRMQPEWNGMPPWWQRILFYPDGKPR